MYLPDSREFYVSAGGDRWTIGRDERGSLWVVHEPSPASGDKITTKDLGMFLTEHRGPEHHALIHLLRSGSLNSDVPINLGSADE